MNKEKIYTIPVHDAFKEPSECPICTMYETLEQNALDFVLGNSYMEDDVRGETNRLGFCNKHYRDLYQGKNRLGLALILHTHMQKVQKDLDELLKNPPGKTKLGFGKKNTEESKLTGYVHEHQENCYICDRINRTFEDYLDTFFYLWKTEEGFKAAVKQSNGFCLHHFGILYELAQKNLSAKALEEFHEIMVPLQKNNFKRVMDDLDWFITKHDYRFKDEPWKTSQDAVPRAIKKTSSAKI